MGVTQSAVRRVSKSQCRLWPFAWSVIYGCAGALEYSSIWYHGVDMLIVSTSIVPKQPEFSSIFGASHCEKVIT